MTRFVAAIVLFLALPYSASAEDQSDRELANTFVEIFERCRTTIETLQPFDASGLDELTIYSGSTIQAWRKKDFPFQIEIEPRDTKPTSCAIRPLNDHAPFNANQLGSLIRALLKLRAKLVAENTHKIIAPIASSSVISLYFSPRNIKRGRCHIISVFEYKDDGSFFHAFTGEQAPTFHNKCR